MPSYEQNPVNEDDAPDSLRATYAGAKRRIATLEEQLKNLQEAGTKRKSCVKLLTLTCIFILIQKSETLSPTSRKEG